MVYKQYNINIMRKNRQEKIGQWRGGRQTESVLPVQRQFGKCERERKRSDDARKSRDRIGQIEMGQVDMTGGIQ